MTYKTWVDIAGNIVYNITMSTPQIVIDTNVIIAALRSKRGASSKLLSLLGTGRFDIHDSVPLVLEYEDVIQRQRAKLGLSNQDVSDFINSLCALAQHHEIYFLWRPFLSDANDELILELAVSAQCDYIVTHNLADFNGIEEFGVKAITPKEFLQIIGEV
jgi:putative PIN family toxin of toxin-antitoxin system